MALCRRDFIALGAASLAAPALPVFAQTRIGSATVTSISDGNLTIPASMIFDPVPPKVLSDVQQAFGLTETLTPPCNLTLMQTQDRTILFDAGAGPEFMASTGLLLDALDQAGLTPDDITDVVFTHAHPDHLWGLVDDFDDLTFPEARYMMGRDEWDYWTDPDTVDTIGDARTTFAVGAARRLGRIADRVTLFDDGEEILPGVAARATYGHTPGHMAFELRQGSDALMILGDCIGNHHMAFQHPGVATGSDQNQDAGAQTRLELLDHLASAQIPVLGFHLPGNGIGRVERDGSAYRFMQDA